MSTKKPAAKTRGKLPGEPAPKGGNKSRSVSKAPNVAKTSARSTVSGPSGKQVARDITDLATAKATATQAMAAAVPHNAAKPSEYGRKPDSAEISELFPRADS